VASVFWQIPGNCSVNAGRLGRYYHLQKYNYNSIKPAIIHLLTKKNQLGYFFPSRGFLHVSGRRTKYVSKELYYDLITLCR
jgi:hypothetical protein